MNLIQHIPAFFKKKYRYSISQLLAFENDSSVREQKCKTTGILLLGFITYSILATIPTLDNLFGHSMVTNISITIFFLLVFCMLKITKRHAITTVYATFGFCSILFIHFITEMDWSIGMDAFWLFILILPFITNYLGGVIYGGISAFFGLLLSVLMFYTRFIRYLQPYGTNMVQWFPVIYVVGMLTATVIEYELTTYQIDKNEADKKLAFFLNERTRRLKEQLAIYKSNEAAIRKYKHDIRHYNRVLAGFIKEKEYDKATAYLQEFDSMLEQVTAVSFCDNQIVNELLTIYASRCQKLGFKPRVKAVVPERIPIEETELTSLVANALENAVEAQEKIDKENRQIKFEITYDGKKLKMISQNPAGVQTSFDENGLPISTRPIQSGIGTKQIKDIAEKYGGAASFTQENGTFILKAVLTCL